ncbi:general transcription factor IIH subunit 4-like [Clavelina lepadiformis]|uniref:general transcription factor IIH subunit 4-like n=1 Tax=Clavelina lepadiformis TaxID=159417 RepID=UPI004041FB39
MNGIERVKLECKSLHQYLCTLPQALLESLYEHPATCTVVFRELPQLAKYYVMRVLFVDKPITKVAVTSWATNEARSEHTEAVAALCDLHVWNEVILPGGVSSAYSLSFTFRKNLQKTLIGGGESWSSTAHLGPDKHAKDVAELDKYATERWEALLHFLVGSASNSAISQDLQDLLVQSGLIRVGEEDGRRYTNITAKGFQFLLLDSGSQVWFFVLEYLNWVRDRGMNLVPILRFIFELSFSSVGKDLPTDGKDDRVLQCLQHFREMGLVMQRKRTSRRFYPTRLVINIASRMQNSSSSALSTGFIIAETNYRIYAYTNSELQYAILALFCEMLYRFPNVCVLQLTRESVQTAVVNGITADQILHFIRANAHPDMLKNDPVIAPTLADQVRLWAMERDRLTFQEGVLYNQFLAQHDFEVLRNYARELGALVWENAAKRNMIVTKDAHDQVKRYWKRYKKESGT